MIDFDKIKGVIFDVDGVILDSMTTWHDSGARLLASMGIQAEEGLGDKLFCETPLSGAAYMKKTYGLPQTVEELAVLAADEMKNFYITSVEPKPYAKELLQSLKDRNLPMVVATSTPKAFIVKAFERLGLIDYFDEILSCNDLGTTKSEPKIFYMAADIIGAKPEEIVVFEDGLYSVKTAVKEGFKTVGVADPISAKDREELINTVDIFVETFENFTFKL